MHKTFENFDNNNVGIIGIPSGEYLELNIEQFNDIHDAKILTYDSKLKSFIFNDDDYDNIIYYISNKQIYKIKKFLDKIGIRKFEINKDYSVDVYESVKIRMKFKGSLPIQFGKIRGDFDCSNCELTSLMGCPSQVDGNFICTGNDFHDLTYGPTFVYGDYNVSQNRLFSLKGSPAKIHKNFYVSHNNLSSLRNSPVIVDGDFDCSNCLIDNLDGSPDIIGNDFDCSFNFLKTLKNGPDMINGTYNCSFNEIETLEDGPNSVRIFKCNNNKLKNRKDGPIDYEKIIW